MHFPFAFDPRYVRYLAPLGIRPERAWVDVDERRLDVRFGRWRLSTPVANIADTCITGPYASALRAIGPRISLADRGLTYGTNTERGLCILFREPVPSGATLGVVKHPGLTVTVADVDNLAAAIRERRRGS
ncbi:MAG: hypothetical protein WEA10_00350 [Actinomycetota bacterium]